MTVVLPVATASEGCAACTQLGATDGLAVTMPRDLYASGGSLTLKLCDRDNCATSSKALTDTAAPAAPAAEWHHVFRWESFDQKFSDGELTATAEVRGAQNDLLAQREEAIDLTWLHPNGEACDGQDFLYGELTLALVSPTR